MTHSTATVLGLRLDRNSSTPIEGVGGPATSLGSVSTRLTIGSITLATTFHVLKSLPCDLPLLGSTDARRFNLTLDFSDNSVRQSVNGLVSLIPRNSFSLKDQLALVLSTRPSPMESVPLDTRSIPDSLMVSFPFRR